MPYIGCVVWVRLDRDHEANVMKNEVHPKRRYCSDEVERVYYLIIESNHP